MKKFLNSKYGETILLIGASIVNLIFTIAYYSVKLTDYVINDVQVRGEQNIWSTSALSFDWYIIKSFNTIFIALFCVEILLCALSALLSLFKEKKWTFFISVSFNLVLSFVILFINALTKILRGGAVAMAAISVVVSVAALTFMIIRRDRFVIRKSKEAEQEESGEVVVVSSRKEKALKIGMIVCVCLITFTYLITLFLPVYTETFGNMTKTFYLIQALVDNTYPLHINIAFMVMVVVCFGGILSFASVAASFAKNNREFVAKSQKYMYAATFVSGAFFVIGYALSFYLNLQYRDNPIGVYSVYSATTVSYIPAIIAVVILVAFSVLQGQLPLGAGEAEARKVKKFKIEPLIYMAIMTAITFSSLALNLISVEISYTSSSLPLGQEVKLSGYELLKNYASLEAGFQIMAFLLLAILLVSGVLLVVSVVNFFAKNNDYYKMLKISAITNFIFVFAIGLFGIYFKIVQKINEENILALLNLFGIAGSLDYVSNVTSQSYFAAIAGFAMLMLMLVRGQFNLAVEPIIAQSNATDDKRDQEKPSEDKPSAPAETAQPDEQDKAEMAALTRSDADVCPAFTELDMKIGQFNAELNKRNENLFTNITLPNLVRFVVDYARECRLHLSYSLEDMATFVAGLGASRLSILQGMSGTGKTSLPKIFTEALMGTCEIVEVESSWRDKNELLGYYNEFSKCYTPKKFTQCLYKARLNSSVPTFIVLDEMNLSRIEYYFSDFLSLMENEEDKREIKLLNVKLSRTVDGKAVEYRGLTDGHTIKIPSNVWFVGTANRDESTFEISDKVYDRAQTMNFNKRAPKVHSFSEPLPQRYASYEMIAKLFEEAKQQYEFDAEKNVTIQKVEKLLMPYNISFGNRILKQMEDFVKIYCTCFGDKSAVESDAVEKILLSKVVSKLENKIVENKQALVTEFNKLGLNRCSAFIQKLNED